MGGGGGRGGPSLSGGGLMLRAHLGLEQQLGNGHRVGVGISRVDFPDGSIQSTQPYLSYAYDFDSHLYGGWPASLGPRSSDTPWLSEQEFAVTGRHYQFAPGVMRDDHATPQSRNMQLLSAQWTGYLTSHWDLTLEAEGALGGQSAGYMQISPGLGYRLPLTAQQAIKLHASMGSAGGGVQQRLTEHWHAEAEALVGAAGGGGLQTGGGLVSQFNVGLGYQLTPQLALLASMGRMQAARDSFRAHVLGLSAVYRFSAVSQAVH